MSDNINTTLKWIGLLGLLSGALCTSFRIDPLNIYLLNTGTLSYLLWAIRIKDVNLIMMNGGMLGIYLLGLLNS